MPSHTELLRLAVDLAHANRQRGGRPFGAVLARDGEVIATGINDIVHTHDPSAHAEMQALRAGTRRQASPSLAPQLHYFFHSLFPFIKKFYI